ncbi:hypothetical protein GYA49_01540 [Candidatus Beckwithbacteria bacterium]|nr:hypothetical protein [Candidatus Beckwithbacteria bacterium]
MSLIKLFSATVLVFIFLLACTQSVFANPNCFITTSNPNIDGTDPVTFNIYLDTDGDQVGAVQIAVGYDSEYFGTALVSSYGSVCSMWAPANSVPPGENLIRTTPYIYSNKAIFSCGILGQGYNGTSGLIGKLTLTPLKDGNTTLTLGNAFFAFLGSSITPGAMSNYPVVISNTFTDPDATPTPTPSPTPTTIATSSATPTPIVTTETIFDDVEVVDFQNNTSSGSTGSTTVGSDNSELDIVEEDNTIPAPPPMTPRAKATPFATPDINYMAPDTMPVGEVLSVQNLRDLLVPGKSQADKTVVMINFISTITFLVLIVLILWKMMMSTRNNKLKSRYIEEMISGELSALESKMAIVKEKEGQQKFQSDFNESVEKILEEFKEGKDKNDEKTPKA